jgi:DNA-binding NarL/FixJ family response regulator
MPAMPTDRPPVRVLVVDDHPMVREGLRSMLAGDSIDVVAEASSGEAALGHVGQLAPDVVLLDLELPDLDGLTLIGRIRAQAPATSVLVVTMHDDPARVRRAVEAGAAGYVLKGVGRRELLAAVHAVAGGGSVLDPVLLRGLVVAQAEAPGDPRAPAGPGSAPRSPLTAVEQDVLRLIAEGLTNREISQRMRWSVGTAKKYVQRILEKLGVSDRTRAAVEALRIGLLD